jgi:DUF1009 family protein
MSPLGLIAGHGVFPFLVADGARSQGRPVIAAALRGSANPELRSHVTHYREVGTLRLNQWIRTLKSHGVTQAIMVGGVGGGGGKSKMHSRMKWFQFIPDFRVLRLYFTRLRHDKRDQAILLAVADELAKEGIILIDSTTYSRDHLATPGVMTRTAPTPAQLLDIDFGFPLCKLVSQNDIGQAIAVVDKDVLAVEAVEGTDRMIQRAGQFAKGRPWTLIKVANAHQDLRFDVPSIGVQTIENLKAANCRCVVLEAGQTMLLEKPSVLALADRCGIAIVGR